MRLTNGLNNSSWSKSNDSNDSKLIDEAVSKVSILNKPKRKLAKIRSRTVFNYEDFP